MGFLWLLFISCWLISSARTQNIFDCHTTDQKPYVLFGTKTAYELVNNKDSSPVYVSRCTPVMFWMLIRHGTRYPSAAEANVMRERIFRLRQTVLKNHKERRGTLCQQDIDALSSDGNLKIDDNFDEALTSTGRDELLLLGRRIRSRFPDFFAGVPYKPEHYKFMHTEHPSSRGSALSFSRGVFPDVRVLLTEAVPHDPLLQFYENCTKWSRVVDQHPISSFEYKLFRESQAFQNTIADVVNRLGFQYNISTDDMMLMYNVCGYQKAWALDRISPWCAAFSEENLKVIEYAEDIHTYYKQGYGFELNYQQACPLLEDLISRIKIAVENATFQQERAVFYFAEAEAILRFIARLGLAEDGQKFALRHDNFIEASQRKWRNSRIAPFAANVALILYNCGSEGFKIKTILKEEAVVLEKCPQELCSLGDFMKHFQPIVDQCAREDFCDPNNASFYSISLFSLIFSVLFHIYQGLVNVA